MIHRSSPGCSKNTGINLARTARNPQVSWTRKAPTNAARLFARARVRNSVVLGEAGIAEPRRNKRTAQLEKTYVGQAGVCDTQASSYMMMTGPWRTCANKCCPWRVMAAVSSSFTPATIRNVSSAVAGPSGKRFTSNSKQSDKLLRARRNSSHTHKLELQDRQGQAPPFDRTCSGDAEAHWGTLTGSTCSGRCRTVGCGAGQPAGQTYVTLSTVARLKGLPLDDGACCSTVEIVWMSSRKISAASWYSSKFRAVDSIQDFPFSRSTASRLGMTDRGKVQ